MISLILPVLNEAPILAEALSEACPGPRTWKLSWWTAAAPTPPGKWREASPSRWVSVPRGRGVQMNAGTRLARGDFFLFLHIDTILTTDHPAALRQAVADPRVGAGAFELRLTPPTPFLRFIAWGANWRGRLFRLPYGDQAIFVRRDLFLALGGFAHATRKTWTWCCGCAASPGCAS